MKRAYNITLSGSGETGEVFVNSERTYRIRGLSGGYRLVASFGDGGDRLIIKIDHDSARACGADWNSWDNYRQTKLELEAYKKIDRADRKYFPEILAHGKIKYQGAMCHWLIEPEYIPDRHAELDADGKDMLSHLTHKYKLSDLSGGDCADDFANWMITENNQIMIYDFAL